MDRFVLTKWYLDSVDAGGRAAILYSTALTWGRARVGWHGVSICETDQRVAHRTSVAPTPLPEREGDRLSWRADAVGCEVDCRPTVSPFAQRLLERGDEFLEWRCEAPAARVNVTLTDAPPLFGVGYAECLSLTVLPWRLPIEDMRWGRWVSDDATRSLVWIDWKGAHSRTDVFLDGRPEPPPLSATVAYRPATSDSRWRHAGRSTRGRSGRRWQRSVQSSSCCRLPGGNWKMGSGSAAPASTGQAGGWTTAGASAK
jgi:hypothetical protein